MPSFDVVSEIDMHEANNAIDQANREVGTRFDFKGSGAKFELDDDRIKLQAESEFQLQQMMDILRGRLTKRGVDVACMDVGAVEISGKTAQQVATLKQGIDQDIARKIVKLVKASKIKSQAAIQGEKIRITGKKRDDLQQIISLLKESDIDVPLQYNNFRD